MSIRIIAGTHRGRALRVPPGRAVRPSASRAREALFGILSHAAFAERDLIDGAHVLDAFAGTGALGLEALSRGAAHASFMERDREARLLLAANIKTLGETGRAHLLAADALHPPRAAAPCDLVLLDPPYGDDVAAAALQALAAAGWIAPGGVIVVELPAKNRFVPPEGFVLRDQRRYGRTTILFLAPD